MWKIFVIYYLLSGAYMAHCLIRYRDEVEKHPVMEMVGFKFVLFMQLLLGFIIAPYVLIKDIKVMYLKRQNRKLREGNQKLRLEIDAINKQRRSKYVIDTAIPEDTKFIDHLNNQETTLGSFIDNILHYLDQAKEKISNPQFVIIKDGRGGWMADGDPNNLLENGHEKIATIPPLDEIKSS